MAKEKDILKPIQQLYKCNSIDLMMFSFVCGVKRVIPSASITSSIDLFIEYNDLTEEEYPKESALVTFTRLSKYFKNRLK